MRCGDFGSSTLTLPSLPHSASDFYFRLLIILNDMLTPLLLVFPVLERSCDSPLHFPTCLSSHRLLPASIRKTFALMCPDVPAPQTPPPAPPRPNTHLGLEEAEPPAPLLGRTPTQGSTCRGPRPSWGGDSPSWAAGRPRCTVAHR